MRSISSQMALTRVFDMHTFIHACAGSGKTQRIVERCASSPPVRKRCLILTLTDSGQAELETRLSKCCTPERQPKVMGWYSFLIQHVIRPYLPLCFPGQKINGFDFNASREYREKMFVRKTCPERYFTPAGCLLRDRVEELAAKVIEAASGRVENRLGKTYAELIIDEVQDISRAGLDVIKALLMQVHLPTFMVGDVRQSLIDSSTSSTKNKKADRLQLLKWFRQLKSAYPDLLTIQEMNHTYRSHKEIAFFSDAIMNPDHGFTATTAEDKEPTGHDGVFLVNESDIEEYNALYRPVHLKYSRGSSTKPTENFITFGKSKGLEWDRVAIHMTKPMIKLLKDGHTFLPEKSACGFYVAVTRARNSLALIIPSGKKLQPHERFKVTFWKPR